MLAATVSADLVFALQRWPLEDAIDRWITISGALIVMGLTVSRLTARLHRLVATLQQQIVTDPLTGLGNRRGLDAHLAQVHRTDDDDQVTALALLDLDGFKAVNDTHGHAAGDALLSQIAQFVEPFDVYGSPLAISSASGVAVALDPEQTPQHLLRAADRAMYDDKLTRRGGGALPLPRTPAGEGRTVARPRS